MVHRTICRAVGVKNCNVYLVFPYICTTMENDDGNNVCFEKKEEGKSQEKMNELKKLIDLLVKS